MSLASEIRKIQTSKTSTDKVQEVSVLFEQYRKYLGFDGKWGDLFSLIKGAVCNSIDTPVNIVAFAHSMELPDHADLFASIFSMGITQGESGTYYVSWSKPLNDVADDVESRIVAILKAAYYNKTAMQTLKILQPMVPKKGLQLLEGDYWQAVRCTPGKKVLRIVEEELWSKPGLYLFCN